MEARWYTYEEPKRLGVQKLTKRAVQMASRLDELLTNATITIERRVVGLVYPENLVFKK